MTAKPLSLQDRFLNSARRSKTPLTIFLLKGVKLQGVITWFDAFSLLLRREGQTQLIYKHSVSTIMPAEPLKLDEVDPALAAAKPALQDAFLSAAEREQQQMTVFLINGVMLQGLVSAHDQFSMVLERGGQSQLIYKHAVSTLQPDHPLSLTSGASEEQDSE